MYPKINEVTPPAIVTVFVLFLIIHQGTVFEADLPEGAGVSSAAGTKIDEVDRDHIFRMLERTGWRVRGPGGAAEALGLKPTTLEARMKKLGIVRK